MKKKTFSQNSDKFGYSFIKNDIVYVYTLYLQKTIILRLFKIDTLQHAYFKNSDMLFENIYVFDYII